MVHFFRLLATEKIAWKMIQHDRGKTWSAWEIYSFYYFVKLRCQLPTLIHSQNLQILIQIMLLVDRNK